MRARGVVVGMVVLALVAGLVWKLRQGASSGSRAEDPRVRAARFARAAEAPPLPPATDLGARAARDDDARGPLRLEGQVIDADERPVAGAHVALDSSPPRRVVSEADGSFVFDGLVARAYALEAVAGDAHAGPVVAQARPGAEPVILRVRAAGSLEVAVVDVATQAPVAGATVELRALAITRGTSDASGVARLGGIGAGAPVLVVSAAGHATWRRMITTAGVPGAPERQRVELRGGGAVAGRVVDAAGRPVAGARVLPEDVAEPFPVLDVRLDAVLSDAQGGFRFDALPAGTYRFVAEHPEDGPGASAPLALDGTTAREGIEIRLEGGARLAGRVVDRAGQPVPAATVRVARAEGFVWQPTRVALADAEGRFDLRGLPRRPVDLLAQAESASSTATRVDFSAGPEALGLTLTLDLDGAIAGVVVSPAGEPVPEALVLVAPEASHDPRVRREWDLRGLARDVADAGGRFEVHGLPPGDYRVHVARPGGSEDALWASAAVSARPGARDLRLVVAEDGFVHGKVVFADGNAPASYAVAFGAANPAPFAAKDGAFRLRVPGGKQVLSVSGASFLTRTLEAVEVAGGADVDVGTVTVERGRSISGRVLRSDGTPVEGAQVVGGAGLTGTGAELFVESESPGAQTTTSDAQGRFVLSGVGPRALAVIAEHEGDGRSASVPLPPGDVSVDVTLRLDATGALEGRVTRGVQPLEKVVLLASPRGAPRSTFFLMTGADGSFRFDRLSAGSYLVSAMLGGGGGRPGDLYGRVVEVLPARVAHLDLDVGEGGVALDVVAAAEGGKPVPAAMVWVLSGAIAGGTADQIFAAVAERGDGSMHNRLALAGQPAHFDALAPGAYSLCALALPGDVDDPAAMQRMREVLAGATIRCTPLTLAASPPAQSTRVVVPN